MNKKQLFWIVPLILTIGYLFGLYLGIPKHLDLTIDYGDNMLKSVEILDNLTISNSNCPACNCECILRSDEVDCFYRDEYQIIRKIDTQKE